MISRTFSENAQKTVYNYFTQSLNSKNSNISETFNQYSRFDYIYDTNFFTQHLKTFYCLGFLSDGIKILPPKEIQLLPYFNDKILKKDR